MDQLAPLEAAVEKVILDPKYKDLLVLVKAVRNGVVYGTKVRFPHALVMVFLFRSGPLRSKVHLVYKATRQHATNLALFAFLYKSCMLTLRRLSPSRKEHPYDTLISGALGGYAVFGRGRSSVNQQIVIYVFARVLLSLAKLALMDKADPIFTTGGGTGVYGGGREGAGMGRRPGPLVGWIKNGRRTVKRNAWPVFASMSWALVMYLYKWYPETLQPSMRSSMTYIYTNADHWDSLRNFLLHNK